MGEFADDAYDRALDELFDGDYEGEYDYPKFSHAHDDTCNRCGAEGLKWRLDDAGNWRLYEDVRIEGNRKKLHECNPATDDDFEVLD